MAEVLGVKVIGAVSDYSIYQIVIEGGLAAEAQPVDKINHAKSCFFWYILVAIFKFYQKYLIMGVLMDLVVIEMNPVANEATVLGQYERPHFFSDNATVEIDRDRKRSCILFTNCARVVCCIWLAVLNETYHIPPHP
ncbi:hypothetical protein BDR05DRAFT_951401 [Suillus weaverae]|nr:hypothetical protein BDR05DRAFT_951401 [Suillus weaverae]